MADPKTPGISNVSVTGDLTESQSLGSNSHTLNRITGSSGELSDATIPSQVVPGPTSTVGHSSSASEDHAQAPHSDAPLAPALSQGTTLSRGTKRSARSALEDETNQYHSDDEKKRQKRSEAAKKPRVRQYLKPHQKAQALRDDEWSISESVQEGSLRCKGCNKIVKLSNRAAERPYEFKNWDAHKNVCPQIIGKEKRRVAKIVTKVRRTPHIDVNYTNHYLGAYNGAHWGYKVVFQTPKARPDRSFEFKGVAFNRTPTYFLQDKGSLYCMSKLYLTTSLCTDNLLLDAIYHWVLRTRC